MKDPVYTALFKIKVELDALAEACIHGVESWDKYNQLVGRAQGMQQALDIINLVLREDEEGK